MEPRGFGPRHTLRIPRSDARQQTVKKRTCSPAACGAPDAPRTCLPHRVGAPGRPGCTIGSVSTGSGRRSATHSATRAAALLAGVLAAAVLLGACTGGDATPSAPVGGRSPGATVAPDPLDVYRAIAASVAEIRQLDAPTRTDPQIIDAEELRANLEAEFDTSNPEAQIRAEERVYRALGLLAEGVSLRDAYLELQGGQVIGYYDPSVDELFIVSRSGGLGPTQRVTYAHEFTHELQDRQFDLESLGLAEATDEGDRALAILALVEGDATSVQTAWMTANLSPVELGQIVAEAADPEILAVLGRAPAILLETSLFAYQAGAAFVGTLLAQGGYWAVDAAYEALPASTEQVIHPEKYLTGEAPVDVALPGDLAARFAGGWTLDAQDTLGEFQLRIWLREGGLAGDVARLAAEGWGGDRLALLAAPGGAGDVVVLVTEWDTAGDAAEFRVAADGVVAGLASAGTVIAKGRRVVIAIGDVAVHGADLDAVLEALAAG